MNTDSFAWSTYSHSSIFLCSFKAGQFQPNISDTKAYLTPSLNVFSLSLCPLSPLFCHVSQKLFRCSAPVSPVPIMPHPFPRSVRHSLSLLKQCALMRKAVPALVHFPADAWPRLDIQQLWGCDHVSFFLISS